MVDFDSLLKFKEAAETCGGLAHQVITEHSRRPGFTGNSASPTIRQQQIERDTLQMLGFIQADIDRIWRGTREWRDVPDSPDLLVQQAVGMKAPPLLVNGLSYATAHEAALALGEAVIDAWSQAGCWACVLDKKANEAPAAYIRFARRLRRLRRNSPGDLYGRLQQELWEAAKLVQEEEAVPDASLTKLRASVGRDRITKHEANIRARQALKNPRLRTVRKLARAIGCSYGLAAKLPVWLAFQEKLEAASKKKPGGAKAVSLSGEMLATTGRDDVELERLVSEQRADFEESPLLPARTKPRLRHRKV